MIRKIKDLIHGVWSHPWLTGIHTFTAFSVLWTLTEGVTHFIPGIKIEGPIALGLIIVFSVGFGLYGAWKPSLVKIKIPNTSTTIEVVFGDLFEKDGIRVIAVNEYFDSELGMPVSDKSLHGMFLQKCFGGHPQVFDTQLDEQLKNVESTTVNKEAGKTESYPIGTTASINVNEDKYIVFALTKTDVSTCKAYSNVTMMWDSLHKLWNRVRVESGGYPVNLPLVGGGLSGIGLPTRDLLNLIILSAITETKSNQITQTIRIVLHEDQFEKIDLRSVKQHWEKD